MSYGIGPQRNEAASPERRDLSAADHIGCVALRIQRTVVVWRTFVFCFFQISNGWLGGSSAGFSPAKRTLDACGKSKLGHGWLRQNAATSHARQREH